MNDAIIKEISIQYGLNILQHQPISSGLINTTIKLETDKGHFILQKINTQIFKNPQAIHDNIFLLNYFLQQTKSAYTITTPLTTIHNKTIVTIDENCYRIFSFISNSKTIQVVENAEQAYEAAKAFANFTHQFTEFDCSKLNIILPNFHNLSLRFQQFKNCLKNGNEKRIADNKKLIDEILNKEIICKKYTSFIQSNQAKQRVTHHDTKISKVLFNEKQQAVCVIDLDTVMQGFFISDVGDMLRTYLSPVSEEEIDWNKIFIRKNILQAIYEGYVETMHNNLTNYELQHFFFSGEVLIYMQALRFLTDYFLNDEYYTIHYPEQNLNRTKNQLKLLQELQTTINNLHFHQYKK